MQHKIQTILIFCDGAGMDGSFSAPRHDPWVDRPESNSLRDFSRGAVGSGGGGSHQYATNILRLARSVKTVDWNGNRQVVFYQSGVGSEANFAGDPVVGIRPLQALGVAVANDVRDAYAFIAQNFRSGDEVCLFGFSRGAYIAMKLAELIDKIGLLSRQNLGHFLEIWLQLSTDNQPLSIPPDTQRIDIKCVGVWDAVGHMCNEIAALNLADTTALPKNVKHAFHAISLQENRQTFLPTLWTLPTESDQPPDQVLKQVWFGGSHSDVGGGYERHELADISLFWMAGEISSYHLIDLDLDFLRTCAQAHPDPWGSSQPHNAFLELPLSQKKTIGHKTRLESGHITPLSKFHWSLQFSPQRLNPTDQYIIKMITVSGPGFVPLYAELNAFEQRCKDQWDLGALAGAPSRSVDNSYLLMQPDWINGAEGFIPSTAIVSGNGDDGSPLYIARALCHGGIQPGKAEGKKIYVGFNMKEIKIKSDYQLLVGPKSSVSWIRVTGAFDLNALNGAIPVRGGNEAHGSPLYIAQAEVQPYLLCPGKVWPGSHAHIPYDGKEKIFSSYNVLVYVS